MPSTKKRPTTARTKAARAPRRAAAAASPFLPFVAPLPPALARRATEVAIAAPQVVAHRVMRMALAGANPSLRDRDEFTLMVGEKRDAFMESWIAMNRAWTQAWVGLSMAPWTAFGAGAPWSQASLSKIAHAGLMPVHRRATGNARRLATTSMF